MENTIVEQLRRELAEVPDRRTCRQIDLEFWQTMTSEEWTEYCKRNAGSHLPRSPQSEVEYYRKAIAQLDRWEADARALLEAWDSAPS